jgi:radical SAM protein with 4Fe4S-binding SPASM domain
MLELASSLGFRTTIFTTLVGADEDDIMRLSKCNMAEIHLHLPDNRGNAKIPVDEKYMKTLALALQTLTINTTTIMNDLFWNNGRAGLVTNGSKPRHLRGIFNCPMLMYPRPVMLPNGDLVLCCMDYGLRHKLGNILEDSYDTIMNRKEFRRIRADRYGWDSDNLCRSCTYASLMLVFYEALHLGSVKELIEKRYKMLI